MRSLSTFISILLVLIGLSCKEDQLVIEPPRMPLSSGTVRLSFDQPPPGITQIVAHITRSGFSEVDVDLVISDSAQSATAQVSGLAAGTWHLRVDALDSTGSIRYSGETDVNIIGGQTTRADLRLLPSSGVLEIHVTWGPPDISSGLVLYYPFEHSLVDSSGNGNTGCSANPTYIDDAWGDGRSAYHFTDTTNAIIVPNSPSLNPAHQLTIAFWLHVDTLVDDYMDILVKGGPVYGYFANREYGLYVKMHFLPYYYLELKSAGDSSGMHELNSQAALPGAWVHFAAVVDRINHTMWFYQNGVATDSMYDSYSTFNTNTDALIIGWSAEHLNRHAPLDGAIDNLRIYNRALTPDEIYAIYSTHQ